MKLQHLMYAGLANHLAGRRVESARTESGEQPRRPPPRPPMKRTRVTRKRPPTEEEIDRARGYVSKLGGQAK
jgi:hypothetical protein